MQITTQEISAFQETVMKYFWDHARQMPWRVAEPNGTYDPYKIMVSEVMLQQTQVQRVIPKYLEFLKAFPDKASLARAELGEVLKAWSGLGYNRRAKFLWQAAQLLDAMEAFPEGVDELRKLPGIGPNTAAAIMVYAFNSRQVFVETNIRTVFIHHFFAGQSDITDKDILALVECTLPIEQVGGLWMVDGGSGRQSESNDRVETQSASCDFVAQEGAARQNVFHFAGAMIIERSARLYAEPTSFQSYKETKNDIAKSYREPIPVPSIFRHWYWALMDYGTYLKQTHGNSSRSSKHYVKQSQFAGSIRQLRGKTLKALADRPLARSELLRQLADDRAQQVVLALESEGMIAQKGGVYYL